MDRRKFLLGLASGLAAMAVAGHVTDAQAMPAMTPAPMPETDPVASEAIATDADIEAAKVENVQYYRRRYVQRRYVRPRRYYGRPIVHRRVYPSYRPVYRRRVVRRRYYY